MDEIDNGAAAPDRRKGAFLKLAVLVLILAGVFAAARLTPLGDYLSRDGIGELITLLRGNPWAPVIFIAIYAAATVLAVPGSVLTLAGGAIFGFYWGTLYNAIAANIGANGAFGMSRALGQDAVRRLVGEDSKAMARLDSVVEQHGFRGLLTFRLIPLVPFNVLNFGSGLLSIRWSSYALATAVGILPGTAIYTFFADALLQGTQDSSGAWVRLMIAGSLLAILSFLPVLLKRLNVRLPGMGARSLLLAACAASTLGFAAHQSPNSSQLPDHKAFTRVLAAVVVDAGVDYARLADDPAGLNAYLDQLGAAELDAVQAAPASHQLAFWINAYNACMLKRVIEHYPIKPAEGFRGLRNRAAGRPKNSVWQIEDVFTGRHCPVAGKTRSQDEIEHEIIRPMGDPRIHFAVNCAALSCPPLVPAAYEPATLDQQLDERVTAFLANPNHFSFSGADGRPVVRVNKVLDWFNDDFGGKEGVLAFLAEHAEGDARTVLADPSVRLDFFDYDWGLNDTSPDPSR